MPLGAVGLLALAMSLIGLAKELANDETIRSKLLKDDSLLSWPDTKLVGVVTNVDAQRLNAYVLKRIADFWCPQWDAPTMIPLDEIKAQAPWFGNTINFSRGKKEIALTWFNNTWD